jgi:DNA helicase-2/ATP-dependent DNA helicase PcrA
VQLTDEQYAIVNHTQGVARVFAVAGAGKTTAMIHRIRRLVREQVFAPRRILASSFSRSTVGDLKQALTKGQENLVRIQTLHSLGYSVIRQAWDLGYLSRPVEDAAPNDVERLLYGMALREARQRNLDFRDALDDIDEEDFLAYLATCKGKLHYANVNWIQIPESAPHQAIAQQANPPADEGFAWYLDLYQLYEELRREKGWIGFDDMMMTSWELLVQHPDLLTTLQNQFDCVMVDEFQDVNRAQFALLDLLVRPHRNYMVIGDDDQTIYEWRGAEGRFILESFLHYNPTTYQITDNFRCTASQVTLANAVIRHNQKRYRKHLNLTKGFDGITRFHHAPSPEQLGQQVVQQVQASLLSGFIPTDIAILVRVYAQTPHIEQALIQANIPYWGADFVPFFRRSETQNFLAFAELACLDKNRTQSLYPELSWKEAWQKAWNRAKQVKPLRFLSKDLKDAIPQQVITGKKRFSQVLLSIQDEIRGDRTTRTLTALASWFQTADQESSAQLALEKLDACLRYRDGLRRTTSVKESGQSKAASVSAMIAYAGTEETLATFLGRLQQLKHQAEQHAQTPERCIRLTTIHQAKGLEWSVVLIPDCNQGTIPFGEELSPQELEEERRLLYVAITRSKQELHLYILKEEPISPFLREAKFIEVLNQTETVKQVLEQDQEHWTASQMTRFLKAVTDLNLERYFQKWWNLEEQQKGAIASKIQQFWRAVEHHNLLPVLDLHPHHIQPWLSAFPAPETEEITDFPGLADLTRPPATTPSLVGLLHPHDSVEHEKFGLGTVKHVEDRGRTQEEIITVDFQRYGVKRILISSRFCTLKRWEQGN